MRGEVVMTGDPSGKSGGIKRYRIILNRKRYFGTSAAQARCSEYLEHFDPHP
jgi:hypothetical protein